MRLGSILGWRVDALSHTLWAWLCWWRGRARWVGWGLVLMLACAPEQRRVSSPSSVALLSGQRRALPSGPFRVDFAGPKGESSLLEQIQIVFSEPIRALAVANDAPTPKIRLSPEIAGRWQWVGTRALTFVPEPGPLNPATRYVVEVPKDLRALNGIALGQAFRWEFATPRPSVVSTEPNRGKQGLPLNTSLKLRFNQPVSAEALKAESGLFALQADKVQPLDFDVVRPNPKYDKLLEVRPSAPLPPASRIEFRISDKLRGSRGPLLSGTPESIGFETYGPFRAKIVCQRESREEPCAAWTPPRLLFTNRVKLSELQKGVRVQPPVNLAWDSVGGEAQKEWYLNGAFRPGKKYSISLDPSLRDTYGQSLEGRAQSDLRFADEQPSIELGVDGSLLEAEQPLQIAITSVNLSEFHATTATLTLGQAAEMMRMPSGQKVAFVRSINGAQTKVFHPAVPKNEIARHSLDLATILKGRRGPIAILTQYSPAPGKTEEEAKLLQVTDLAITAKISEHSAHVWVTRLSTGAPVPGASVEILNQGRRSKSYLTDEAGLAQILEEVFPQDENLRAPPLIVAQTAQDLAYQEADTFLYSQHEAGRGSVSRRYYGVLFTDRDIYRPGDEVKVKGIVRRESKTGNDLPGKRRFQVILTSPNELTHLQQMVTTSDYGSFDLTFRLPATASPGAYQLDTEGLKDGELSANLTVAEYRSAEFKVNVESSAKTLENGDHAEFTIRGDYLYGAPLPNARVTYRVSQQQSWFKVPNSEGFSTNASVYYEDMVLPFGKPDPLIPSIDLYSLLKKGTSVLDARGRFSLPVDLAILDQTAPVKIAVEAELTDSSRQALAGNLSVVLHPASFYVGLKKPTNAFVEAPATVSAEFLALDPSGNHVAGRTVEIELVRRRFKRLLDATSGFERWVTHSEDQVVSRCSGTTGAIAVGCALKIPAAGYFFVLAKAKDDKGRETRSAYTLYGIGSGESAWREDKEELELVLDKAEYNVGETARLLVKSPFPEADAIITIERDGVYETRRTKLFGSTPTLLIPVTDAIRPNAYVSVHLLRPRTAPLERRGKPDLGAPTFRSGVAELRVNAEPRRLRISLKPNKVDFQPGDEVSVDVGVSTADGKPHAAEVTLYAVDEGVLSLSKYQKPDPHEIFTASRMLGVDTIESREMLGRMNWRTGRFELASLSYGDGVGVFGSGKRSETRLDVRIDFRTTAYFNPTLAVGPTGTTRASFRLPDSLTSYRIMAVAASLDDRYGSAETNITTSKPLMARPALPRFIRAGDNLQAGVVVSAKGLGPTQVNVAAEATAITLLGPAVKAVTIEQNTPKEVRFAFRAGTVGDAKFTFKVTSASANDQVALSLPVESPANVETVALYGETKTQAIERLGDLNSIRRDIGSLTLSASSTALIGLDAGMSQLIEYPYDCTEQLASRILPLLSLRNMATDFGFKIPPNADALVERTVAEIIKRQGSDGGFGLWPNSESSPWITPYALWVLHEAKGRKFDVPEWVLEQGKNYLRTYVTGTKQDDRINRASRALILDVLAMLGSPESAQVARLAAKQLELPAFANALLLHAMVVGREPKTLIEPLLRTLENTLHISGNRAFSAENIGNDYAVLMDSPARSSALVLRALVAARPKHVLAAPLARGLLFARRGGTWQNTQETAFALLALSAYRAAQESEAPKANISVFLGEQPLLTGQFASASVVPLTKTVPLNGLRGGDLIFSNQGAGTLFYEARLRYADTELPQLPLDRGFSVQKTLRSVEAQADGANASGEPRASQTEFHGGDLVLTDLVVVTSIPREYVVIDDRIAAALQPIDTNLSTAAAWLSPALMSVEEREDTIDGVGDDYDARAHGRPSPSTSFRQELKDDRVLFFIDHLLPGIHHFRYLSRATSLGEFVTPATKVEEMYSPENFGTTAASVIRVQ